MASKIYEFNGIGNWVKVFKGDDKYKRWTLTLTPDKESYDLIKKSGLQLKEREGESFQFSRSYAKMINGQVQEYLPPRVFDVHGKEGVYGEKNLIGNGSELSIRVSVYDTVKGKGHRLESVKVIHHVPYTANEVIKPNYTDSQPDLPFSE